MKTQKEWNDSELNFTEFAQPMDEVDEEIFDYFLGVVPPQYRGSGLLQSGEPVFSKNGVIHYMTFSEYKDKYHYLGCLPEFKQ